MTDYTPRQVAYGALGAFVAVFVAYGLVAPNSAAGKTFYTAISASNVSSALRLSVPIAFAALGGIFAEKSGVINIGLEGLLIVAAFAGVAVTDALATSGSADGTAVWVGFAAAVLASTLLAGLFAVVTIEFEADQIIAGLAVWLIALGLAPFASTVIWGGTTSDPVPTMGRWTVPVLSEIPYVGEVLFDANPTVYLLLAAVPLSWFLLYRTAFGRWIRASGENPKALDTVGVDVNRVRYAGVLLSGVLSGVGGGALAPGLVNKFVGTGATMVDGRGWIAITAYLFGNYNPLGAFGASVLFAGLDALQFRLQQIGAVAVPNSLIQTVPYVTVIVVLALVGKTRIPEAAGEHYEPGED